VTGRGERRRKQLLNGLKEKRGYCKLKEEALNRNQWRTRFGRCYGAVVRKKEKRMNVRCKFMKYEFGLESGQIIISDECHYEP